MRYWYTSQRRINVKEILKMMKFCSNATLPAVTYQGMPLVMIIFAVFGFFMTPVGFVAVIGIMVMSMVLSYPDIEDKSCYNQQYGILPVKRKNIARGKIYYAFAVAFVSEFAAFLLGTVSYMLKLGGLLPLSSEYEFVVKDSFCKISSLIMSFDIFVGVFFGASVLGTLLYMLFTVFGRENKSKIYLALVMTVLVIMFAFIILNENDLIPVIQLKMLDESFSPKKIIKWVVFHLVSAGLTVLFAEISAAKYDEKEL